MLEITVKDLGTEENETVQSEGCLVFYFDKSSNIKTLGKINLKALTPLVSKIIMDRMSK